MGTYTTCSIGHLPEAGTVRIAGQVLSVRRMTTKKGNLMARFVLEDLEGEVEVTIFPKGLTPEVNALLVPGSMLVVKGQVENREAGNGASARQLLVEEILTFVAARERFVRMLTITVQADQADDALFNRLKEVFGKYPGLCRVHLRFPSSEGDVMIETRAGIKPVDAFIAELEAVVGPESWSFGKPSSTPVTSRKLPPVPKPALATV
jgi:DNA polymerase-3 subunit alpha